MNVKVTLTKTKKGWQAQSNKGKIVIQTGGTIKECLQHWHYAFVGAPDNNVAVSRKWASTVKLPAAKDNKIVLTAKIGEDEQNEG